VSWRGLADGTQLTPASDSLDDRKLARQIVEFVKDMPMLRNQAAPTRDVQRSPVQPEHVRRGPDIER
jgi:hypothetical protein